MEKLHLFKENDGGDLYAARDLAHAKGLWESDTGQDPDDGTSWDEIPDDAPVKMDDDGVVVTKKAGEWAAEVGGPGCIGGENY